MKKSESFNNSNSQLRNQSSISQMKKSESFSNTFLLKPQESSQMKKSDSFNHSNLHPQPHTKRPPIANSASLRLSGAPSKSHMVAMEDFDTKPNTDFKFMWLSLPKRYKIAIIIVATLILVINFAVAAGVIVKNEQKTAENVQLAYSTSITQAEADKVSLQLTTAKSLMDDTNLRATLEKNISMQIFDAQTAAQLQQHQADVDAAELISQNNQDAIQETMDVADATQKKAMLASAAKRALDDEESARIRNQAASNPDDQGSADANELKAQGLAAQAEAQDNALSAKINSLAKTAGTLALQAELKNARDAASNQAIKDAAAIRAQRLVTNFFTQDQAKAFSAEIATYRATANVFDNAVKEQLKNRTIAASIQMKQMIAEVKTQHKETRIAIANLLKSASTLYRSQREAQKQAMNIRHVKALRAMDTFRLRWEAQLKTQTSVDDFWLSSLRNQTIVDALRRNSTFNSQQTVVKAKFMTIMGQYNSLLENIAQKQRELAGMSGGDQCGSIGCTATQIDQGLSSFTHT